MTDLLDELRAANPVDAATLEIPAELRARALAAGPARGRGRRRPRRALRLGGLAAAAACGLAGVLLLGDRAPAPDLSARAYAATTGPGIIHWRTEIASSSGGRVGSRQRTEGWARNGVTHELRYDVVHGKEVLQSDSRTAGGRTTTWIRAEHDYLRFPARRHTGTDPFQFGDPFAIFRRAYRAGKLTKVGPTRFGIDLPGRSDDARRHAPLTYYDIDPKTALPIRFVVKSPARPQDPGLPGAVRPASQTVMTFAVYEQLPFDAETRKLLRLLPHPAGGPKEIPAAEHFAVLRTGARPNAAGARVVRTMSRRRGRGPRTDPAAARTIAPQAYLVPGPAHVCLVRLLPRGSGSGCATTQEALERGLGSLDPGRGWFLVVPDGVRAVRARLRGGRHERVAVHGNVARLPSAAFAWRFVR